MISFDITRRRFDREHMMDVFMMDLDGMGQSVIFYVANALQS